MFQSPLLNTAHDGNVEQIQYILKDFINRTVNEENQTALHLAAKNGHAGVVEELLKHGADPNVQDEKGNTPLHLVCRQNVEEDHDYSATVDHLLQHPTIDVNIKNKNQDAPLVASLKHKQRMIALKLIQHGASVTVMGRNGYSALHLLVANFSDHYEKDKDFLDKILEHNDIDIDQQNKDGFTALNSACYECPSTALPQLVQHLLDKGAQADIQSHQNVTALHRICQ